MNDIDKTVTLFNEWLNNTKLAERTILNYTRAVRRFLTTVDEITIDTMNNYIQRNAKDKRNYYIRYALLKFLKFANRDELIIKIEKIKQLPRKKEGTYVTNNILLNIVNNVQNEKFKVVALIQYLSGARAGDVLGFDSNNHWFMDDGTLQMKLRDKGGNTHIVFIPQKYALTIAKFIQDSKKQFPFLDGKTKSMRKLIDNNYRYYYTSLKESAFKCNVPKFSSHDFRRNLINEAILTTKDLRSVMHLVGHKRLETTVKYVEQARNLEESRKLAKELRG